MTTAADLFGQFNEAGKLVSISSQQGQGLPVAVGAIYAPKWLSALGRVQAGTGQAVLALIGDSTTVSAGAGGGAKGADNARVGALSARLVSLLQAEGVPASDESFFGEHLLQAFNGVNFATYDTRFSVAGGASFYPDGQFQSLGGLPWRLNAAGHEVRFTTSNQVDTAKIIFANRLGGTFDTTFAGGPSLGLTSANATSTVGTVTKTFARSAGQLALKWSSGNNAIIGAILYDSVSPKVNVVNLGCYGDKVTSANGYANNANEWRGGAALSALSPDLTVIDMTINSLTQDGAQMVPQYRKALSTIVQDALSTGSDVVIATPNPVDSPNQYDATFDAYMEAIFSVASQYGVRVLDVFGRLGGDWSKANARGLFFDSLHPNAAGYAAKAIALKNELKVW